MNHIYKHGKTTVGKMLGIDKWSLTKWKQDNEFFINIDLWSKSVLGLNILQEKLLASCNEKLMIILQGLWDDTDNMITTTEAAHKQNSSGSWESRILGSLDWVDKMSVLTKPKALSLKPKRPVVWNDEMFWMMWLWRCCLWKVVKKSCCRLLTTMSTAIASSP